MDFARHVAGGRAAAIRIADIEGGWFKDHEDLPKIDFMMGVNWGVNLDAGNHGTAVLGQLAAVENGFGSTGIAPDAVIGWSSVTSLEPIVGPIYFYSVANALLRTGNVLQPGDIALIEQHFQNSEGQLCTPATDPCNDCSIPLWRAVEEFPYEHAAISMITAAGLIVVEAAGNGRTQVTPASSTDSGAIVVGARMRNGSPFCWSNYGLRVNVSSWGGGIGTLGYSEIPSLRANGDDPNQWYTTSFGGTSGASPIVVGSAAIIQSTRVANGLRRLSSQEMRALLASTGTPQAIGSIPNVGSQPNLRAAIATYKPDSARFVKQTLSPSEVVDPNSRLFRSVTFANNGGIAWEGMHKMAIAPSGSSGIQEFNGINKTLGSPITFVFPGEEVEHVFEIQAPAQPGTYSLAFEVQNPSGQRLAISPSQQVVVVAASGVIDNAEMTITSAPGSLRAGESAVVTVTARNTGTSTWESNRYLLRLQRVGRLALPQQTAGFTNPVSPGTSIDISFPISCNAVGQGGFSVQMTNPFVSFGQIVGQNVVCQNP